MLDVPLGDMNGLLIFIVIVSFGACAIVILTLLKKLKHNFGLLQELKGRIQAQEAELNEKESQLADIRRDVKDKDTAKQELVHNLASRVSLINGSLEGVLDNKDLDLPLIVRAPIDAAKANTRQLFSEIRQLIDVNAQGRGELVLKKEKVLAVQFFKEVVNEISHQLEQRGVEVSYRSIIPENLAVELDAFRVERLFLKILSEIACESGKCSVEIDAKTSENQDSIRFDFKFQREELSIREGIDDIGLFSKSKAEIHLLSLEWEEEWSDKVYILSIKFGGYIDHINSQSEPASSTKIDPLLQTANVLVVEDFAQMRKFITKLLCKKYKVLEAHNGLEALEILETTRIDLVISDLMMPGMNGIELLRVMKAHEDWKKLPFVMLTAKDDDTSKLGALKSGLDDYVIKPFQSAELMARVYNILNRRNQPGELDALTTELSFNQEFMLSISTIVDERLADPVFGVDDLVDQSNLSKRSLYRRLKDETGFTPSQYIKERRLLRARECLRNRSFATVAEVGHAVGYNSSRLFSEQFYQRFGKKPSDFMAKATG